MKNEKKKKNVKISRLTIPILHYSYLSFLFSSFRERECEKEREGGRERERERKIGQSKEMLCF